MKKNYCLLVIVLICLSNAFAQENHLRNSKWFSYGKMLEFGGPSYEPDVPAWHSPPQIFQSTPYNYPAANVCDNQGNTLIVVEANGKVWAKGQLLGNILINHVNVIIVPKPLHMDRYYIVCSGVDYGLSYTEVDLQNMILINPDSLLNDSNGQPVSSSSGGSGVASTVHSNGKDYWVTAFANNMLSSYLITENGISENPASSVEIPSLYFTSPDVTLNVKMSPKSYLPNIKRIAIINFYSGIFLKVFNDETGEIADDTSTMAVELAQKELQNMYNMTWTKDAEFSHDGSLLTCIGDSSTYGPVFTVNEWGSISTIDEINSNGFIAIERGPDGYLYFLDGNGRLHFIDPNIMNLYPLDIWLFGGSGFQQWGYLPQLVSINECLASPPIPTFDAIAPICAGGNFELNQYSKENFYGSWTPAKNNMATTTYNYTPQSGYCALPTTMTVTVNPYVTPTFDAIPYVCSGMPFSPLPLTSNNGISGTWSPAFNNSTATTYTFTPAAGQCITGSPQTMTIPVNPIITPIFDDVSIFSGSSIDYTLPTTSTNSITGTWIPSVLTEGDHEYTFVPNGGTCNTTITKNFLWLKPSGTLQANDDQFYVDNSDSLTPSVLDNDINKEETVLTANDVDFTVESMSIPQSYLDTYMPLPELGSNGTIYIPYRFIDGVFSVTYKITKRGCPDDYSIATAVVMVGSGSVYSKMTPKDHSDKIVAYPNPSSGVFHIDLVESQGDYDTIEVFNMLGVKVYEGRFLPKGYNAIDLGNMTTGCYLAKVSGISGSKSFQLIKQ